MTEPLSKTNIDLVSVQFTQVHDLVSFCAPLKLTVRQLPAVWSPTVFDTSTAQIRIKTVIVPISPR